MESIFRGPECTLQEILDSREERVRTYSKLSLENKCSNVVTLCVNMPGSVKDNPASRLFFSAGRDLLTMLVFNPVFTEEKHDKTGHELYIGTHFDSIELKESILDIEKRYHWMRMLDIDVIDSKMGHIERSMVGQSPLSCFVCGNDAKTCGAGRTHTESEIKSAITEYFIEVVSYLAGSLASKSLIKEAMCTPKPGLVDMNNNGSHKDMNLKMLTRSAIVLQPYFEKMCHLGFQDSTLDDLRDLGRQAEDAMYKATNNVNTHKGAIFCIGLLCYCYAKCLKENEQPTPEAICTRVQKMVQGIDSEVSPDILTKRGLGARGQALDGYKLVTELALPFFNEEINISPEQRALSLTLLLLVSVNEDSNILSRSDAATLEWAKQECGKLFSSRASEEAISNLDNQFIQRNISPGGSADLLAATYFLHYIPILD